MHRLSSVARHSKNSSKMVNLTIANTQRDQAHRYPSHGRKKKTVSFGCVNPKMSTKTMSHVSRSSLVPHISFRNMSNFLIHPEKLKQILKERDGQNLCNYYDSDNYKMKAVDVVEEQSRVIDELTPRRVKEDVDVTYEHMINCAQPRKKPKIFVVTDDKEENAENVNQFPGTEQNPLVRKLLRVREGAGEGESPTRENRSNQATPKESKRKYRKRTTILPLYLKKMQDNQAVNKEEKFKHHHHSDSEGENTKVAFQITKSEYRVGDEEPVYDDQRLKLRKKVLNAEYENEVARRSKTHSKNTVGKEEERHWYQK